MSEAPRNPPYLVLYTESKRVVDGEERTFRNRAGVAFPIKNGTGFNVHVDTNLLVMNEAALLPPLRDGDNASPAAGNRAPSGNRAPARNTRPGPTARGRPGNRQPPRRPDPAPAGRPPAFTDDFDDTFDIPF